MGRISSDLQRLLRIKQRRIRRALITEAGLQPSSPPVAPSFLWGLQDHKRASEVTGTGPRRGWGWGEDPSSSLALSRSGQGSLGPPGRARTQKTGRGHFWAWRYHPSFCSVMVGRGCCVWLFRLFTVQAWCDSGSGELELQSPNLLNLLSLFKSSSKPGIQKSPS